MSEYTRLVGDKVRFLRRSRHLTQEELAEKASVSVKALSRIENHQSNYQINTLEKIAGALEIDISLLLNINFLADEIV